MKIRRRVLFLPFLMAGIAGCGSSGSTPAPTATAVAPQSYTDPRLGFSFAYPGDWKAPKQGSTTPKTGTNNYFVHLSLPNQVAGVEVEVSGQVTQFPPITNGEQRKDPKGPDIFTYYHARAAGYPALRVTRSFKGQVDEIVTFINVGHREYAVKTVTVSPPFPAFVTAGYNLVVRTLRVPKS